MYSLCRNPYENYEILCHLGGYDKGFYDNIFYSHSFTMIRKSLKACFIDSITISKIPNLVSST